MAAHRFRAASVLGLAVALLVALNACTLTPNTYVATGDSYAAGPLIPDQVSPLGCLRSNHNYASLIAPTLGLPNFHDVTCSGAETPEFWAAQNVTPGPANPPQLDAIDGSTKVVTVQIGGNDIGFSSIVKDCINLDPTATPCKNKYVTASGDELNTRINATKPKIAAIIVEIHRRAPSAKVLMIGYPSILPDTGDGCWPSVPILPTDVAYLRGVEKQLNAMIYSAAANNHASYVDIFTPTLGHDACSSNKWVEGVIPGSSAAPVHPNAAGMQAQAAVIGPKVKAAIAG